MKFETALKKYKEYTHQKHLHYKVAYDTTGWWFWKKYVWDEENRDQAKNQIKILERKMADLFVEGGYLTTERLARMIRKVASYT